MLRQIFNETSFLTDKFSGGLGLNEIEYLKEKYQQSSRRRHRICFHQNTDVSLHDIVITYDSNSYIPPNKHIGKAETICLLKGTLEIFIFNDAGKCFDAFRVSAEQKKYPFILRMPPNTWHGLRVISEGPCLVKETINGPYSKESLQWADFAPNELENEKNNSGYKFYENLAKQWEESLENPRKTKYIQTSENVLINTSLLAVVDNNVTNLIKKLAKDSELKRARLCLHSSSNNDLQDMIIFLDKGCNIPISYHLNKDESLVVLDGEGRYDFFNEDNSLSCKYKLKTYSELINKSKLDSRCFTRINRFSCHKIIPGDDGIMIYEATTGPFQKGDTAYKTKNLI